MSDDSGLLIAAIPKNQRERIEVRRREFMGFAFIDVRIWYSDDGVLKPTGKGVTIAPAKLPELIAALQDAEAEARAAGLIS